LRHAAGSIVAQGAGLLVARDVLGHAHVSTTNRYLQGKTDARAIAVMNAAFGVSDADGGRQA
jgi:site-specific recombinase XerD